MSRDFAWTPAFGHDDERGVQQTTNGGLLAGSVCQTENVSAGFGWIEIQFHPHDFGLPLIFPVVPT